VTSSGFASWHLSAIYLAGTNGGFPPIAAVSDDQDDRPLRSSGHGLMSPQPTAQQLTPQLQKNPGEPRRDAKCQHQTVTIMP
jgi:hypothetical protein